MSAITGLFLNQTCTGVSVATVSSADSISSPSIDPTNVGTAVIKPVAIPTIQTSMDSAPTALVSSAATSLSNLAAQAPAAAPNSSRVAINATDPIITLDAAANNTMNVQTSPSDESQAQQTSDTAAPMSDIHGAAPTSSIVENPTTAPPEASASTQTSTILETSTQIVQPPAKNPPHQTQSLSAPTNTAQEDEGGQLSSSSNSPIPSSYSAQPLGTNTDTPFPTASSGTSSSETTSLAPPSSQASAISKSSPLTPTTPSFPSSTFQTSLKAPPKPSRTQSSPSSPSHSSAYVTPTGNSSSSSGKFNIGALLGGSLGGVLALVVLGVLAGWLFKTTRRKRLSKDFDASLGKGNFF